MAEAYLRWLYRLQLAYHAVSSDRGVLAAGPLKKAFRDHLKQSGPAGMYGKVRGLPAVVDRTLQAQGSQGGAHEEMMKKDKEARRIVNEAFKDAFEQAGFPPTSTPWRSTTGRSMRASARRTRRVPRSSPPPGSPRRTASARARASTRRPPSYSST